MWASLVAQMVKNLLAIQETWVLFLGWEDPLQKEMAIHSTILFWRIPWTEEPGELQSMGCHKESDTTEKLTFRVCVWVCVWFFSSLFQKDWSSPLNVKGIFYCIDFVRKYTPSTGCCSVTKSCPTLCNPIDCSMPGFPVLHYLPEFAQIHVH